MPTRSPSDTAGDPTAACSLSPAELEQRAVSFSRLVATASAVEELDDGFRLVFPSSEETIGHLVDLIVAERRCCPSFAFELVLEPEHGPLRLRLRGPESAISIVRPFLAERGEPS